MSYLSDLSGFKNRTGLTISKWKTKDHQPVPSSSLSEVESEVEASKNENHVQKLSKDRLEEPY